VLDNGSLCFWDIWDPHSCVTEDCRLLWYCTVSNGEYLPVGTV